MAITSATLAAEDLRRARHMAELQNGLNPSLSSPPGYPARVGNGPVHQTEHASASSAVSNSAVCWGAIVAGALAAAALSLILLMLGVGLGLSSVSPWAQSGVSASGFGVVTILWLTLTQLVASGMGGYLAGRLRTQWLQVHGDEVYFRDTAHGFLAWALASLATAALVSSAIASVVSGGVQAGATVAGAVGAAGLATAPSDSSGAAAGAAPLGYFVDALFRKDSSALPVSPAPNAGTETSGGSSAPRSAAAESAEILRIFVNNGRAAVLAPEDSRQVAMIVAQRTGMPMLEAQKRVTEVYAKAQAQLREAEVATRSAADKVRKASAYGALWLFISLLIGAFAASWAATLGGQRRNT